MNIGNLRACLTTVVCLIGTFFSPQLCEAAAEDLQPDPGSVMLGWGFCFFGALTALVFAFFFFRWMTQQDEGDENMIRIAENVRA